MVLGAFIFLFFSFLKDFIFNEDFLKTAWHWTFRVVVINSQSNVSFADLMAAAYVLKDLLAEIYRFARRQWMQ